MGDIEINNESNNSDEGNDDSRTKSSHRHSVSTLWKSRKSNNSTPPVPPKSIHEHTRRGCEYNI